MTLLESYKNKRSEILMMYDALISSGILPITCDDYSYTVEELNSKKDDLLSGRFYVAVVGEIKTGKSSLLNILIFKDDIMPTGNTPLTSAITYIKYTDDKPYFEAIFYTHDEWDIVKKCISESEEYNERFKKTLNYMMNNLNINCTKLLGNTHRFTEHEKLIEYVAPVGDGEAGKYSTIVKEITFYHNISEFKDIIFVDTPGTNDPNELRSKRTIDFLNKADAVLYVMYANQLASDSDITFINTYLPHISDNNKFLVINKADGLGGSVVELDKWFNNSVLNNEFIKTNNIFTSSTTRVYISALAERLFQKESKNIKLDDNDKEYRNILESANFDMKNNHKQFENLLALLDKKLILNKAENLLLTHREIIRKIHGNAIKIEEKNLYKLEQQINDINTPLAELEKKKDGLLKAMEDIKEKQEDTLSKLKGIDNDTRNKFSLHVDEFERVFNKKTSDILNNIDEKTIDNLPYKIEENYRDIRVGLRDNLIASRKGMTEDYRNVIMGLQEGILNDVKIPLRYIDDSFSLSTDDYFEGFDKMITTYLKEEIKQINDKNSTTWQKIKGKIPFIPAHLDNIKKETQRVVSETTGKISKELKEKFKVFINKGEIEIRPKLKNIIQQHLQSRYDNINKYTQNIQDKTTIINKLEKNVSKTKANISSYKKILKSFN